MKLYITQKNISKKTAKWLKQIEPYNIHDLRLNVKRSALLVVDMQNFFLDPNSKTYTCSGNVILPNVKKLVSVFRDAKRPVIFTRHVHNRDLSDAGIMGWWWDGMCIEGSAESEIHPELSPLRNEKQIFKHRYSAFYNTDLEIVLRCLKIEDIVISGVMTNMCCESTARDAYYRDYRVFFIADATGTVSEEMHIASLLNLAFGFAHITTTDEIVSQIEKYNENKKTAKH